MVMELCSFKQFRYSCRKYLMSGGHAGATGAYLFYHPKMDAYFIGTFK